MKSLSSQHRIYISLPFYYYHYSDRLTHLGAKLEATGRINGSSGFLFLLSLVSSHGFSFEHLLPFQTHIFYISSMAASPKMPRGLSLLPPELLVNISQSLSSPKDLHTIIRTSTQFYQVFATYKQSILSAILLRAIPQEIESDFILAYRAQRVWKPVLAQDTARKRRLIPWFLWGIRNGEHFDSMNQACTAILDGFGPEKGERLRELVSDDRTLLLSLWEFYSNFEHFMLFYSTRAMSSLRQSSFSDSNEPLSFSEQTRMQRAFFRCEIYTCLFQLTQAFDRDIDRFLLPKTDPALRFVAMLRFFLGS